MFTEKPILRKEATPARSLRIAGLAGIVGALIAAIAGSVWVVGGQNSLPGFTPALKPAFVVAELFTSEGCSSCPPADDLLAKLVEQQPVPGVTVVGLSESVDYWNRLGWVDPFSSNSFTQRQMDYESKAFHGTNVFTPQLVIDGAAEEVGSDAGSVYRAIARAAMVPKAAMKVSAEMEPAAGSLRVRLEIGDMASLADGKPIDVVVAVAENDLTSDVPRGENSGRRLRHAAVARKLQVIGEISNRSRASAYTASLPMTREWKAENIKVIGFLQERESRRIVGAGWSQVSVGQALR